MKIDKRQSEIISTMQPLYSQVIIVRDKDSKEHQSKGGIVLTGDNAPKQVTGTVVAVGHGRMTADGSLAPLLLKVGDYVRYRENFGDTFHVEGYEFHALQESDVICKLAPPDVTWED